MLDVTTPTPTSNDRLSELFRQLKELDPGYPPELHNQRRDEFIEKVRQHNDGPTHGLENNLRDAGFGSAGPM